MNSFVRGLKDFIVKTKVLYPVAKRLYRGLATVPVGSSTKSLSYDEWIRVVEPTVWEKPAESKDIKFSILVPAFNTPDKYLNSLIDSILSQTYSNWELCISDASTDKDRVRAIKEKTKGDKRIIYSSNPGLHISENTNRALDSSTGDYIGLLDHDDILSPHALNEVYVAIKSTKDAELIYSDEDKLSDDGLVRQLPFFKPDWSPDLLLGVNYITHFTVIKKSLIKKIGGLRPEYNGAQDYDLILRATEVARKIIHIPKILYHWRLADGSTAKSAGEKDYADTAGQNALKAAVERRGIGADVVGLIDQPTNYRLKYKLKTPEDMVSIIIPFKDQPDLLKQCVNSITSKTTYSNYEIILLSNNSVEGETHEAIRQLKKDERVTCYEWNNPFNYSKINNFGVAKSKGKYITLLNNDTEVITPEWLDELVGVASQPGVGAVGPLLLYPDKKNGIQHAGVILGMGTMAGHVFRHLGRYSWTHFGMPAWPRNYLAVTAACMVLKKSNYEQVGGLDENFMVAGNDVAMCLRLHESGLRNIYWPFASLKHHESVSVGTYNNGIQGDYDLSLRYYNRYHKLGDPYFNKNLDLMNEQIGMRGLK